MRDGALALRDALILIGIVAKTRAGSALQRCNRPFPAYGISRMFARDLFG